MGIRWDKGCMSRQTYRESADVAACTPQSLRQIIEETRRFVVFGIERQPGELRAARAQPVKPGERERPLAETSRRLDYREPFVVDLFHKTVQSWTINQARRQTGWERLREK